MKNQIRALSMVAILAITAPALASAHGKVIINKDGYKKMAAADMTTIDNELQENEFFKSPPAPVDPGYLDSILSKTTEPITE